MDRHIVLFLCSQGAAKSVLAAALCQHMATERHLPLQAVCAGTEPDLEVAPHGRALLVRERLDLPRAQPQRVTVPMLAEAAALISLGCDQAALPATPQHWEPWSNVPPPSQDLHGAYTMIQQHLVRWLDTWERKATNG
jgi:protein-tyrosine-phosphatase